MAETHKTINWSYNNFFLIFVAKRLSSQIFSEPKVILLVVGEATNQFEPRSKEILLCYSFILLSKFAVSKSDSKTFWCRSRESFNDQRKLNFQAKLLISKRIEIIITTFGAINLFKINIFTSRLTGFSTQNQTRSCVESNNKKTWSNCDSEP